MSALTFVDWRAKGRHVKRGEQSTQRNAAGEALFTLEQTDVTRPYMGRFGGGRFGSFDDANDADYAGWTSDDLNPNEGSK